MTPMVKTLAGLAGGWVISRGIGLAGRLQAGHGESNAQKLHSRRLFTRNAVLGGAGVLLLQAGAGFVYLLWPNKTGAFGGKIAVAAASSETQYLRAKQWGTCVRCVAYVAYVACVRAGVRAFSLSHSVLTHSLPRTHPR